MRFFLTGASSYLPTLRQKVESKHNHKAQGLGTWSSAQDTLALELPGSFPEYQCMGFQHAEMGDLQWDLDYP